MESYFKVEEFLITGDKPEDEIIEKIEEYHIKPMNLIREAYNAPIYVSKSSGYRPVWYEKQKGRSGNSQHTFKGKGAADYRAGDMECLLELIIEDSPYTRICYYPKEGFIHCDYKKTVDGKRRFYKAYNGKWKFMKNI